MLVLSELVKKKGGEAGVEERKKRSSGNDDEIFELELVYRTGYPGGTYLYFKRHIHTCTRMRSRFLFLITCLWYFVTDT